MPAGKKCSMAEIAQICNVSKATVSRIINNNPQGVGEETRRRVLKVIAEKGYRPNTLARSVATSKSGMVGLIIPDVSNFFYPKIIRGVTDYMDSVGYSVILGNSDYNPKKEAEQLMKMIDRRVDGILLCSGVSNKDFLADFKKYKVPLGLVGRSFDSSLSDVSVRGDNVKGGYISAKYLLKGGNRRIAYVEGNAGISGSKQRKEGYQKALRESGIRADKALIFSGEYSIEYGKKAADLILNNPRRPDAVMTGSDLIAIGLVSQLLYRGVRIPEEMEIIGYDNIELTTVFSPLLTTVSKPHYDMASHISRQIIGVIEDGHVPLAHTLVEPKLVFRETTRKRAIDKDFI